ncbi:ABC transporter substrate-binding protein [Agrobacterium sp. SHOUNA12C]|uniref:ABC transporter substrate-binding protein n=1 Tax=Rhizobium rhizogenes TaxID=359 RepID=UPI000647CE06|nr:ABC transporter substrate-binding protein [Rhizobium rhizogenes]KAA6486416.1 ABC transporter substrate-binding protein [Agrobacterium sp. ICMP 7243]MCJ9719332.1 ABC transporter substrate-binding protein [Agrobacterium sp. BETTINA12B]MCJ9758788.1 ABC transporter substrate-binding protein [Agrobacterium sp. SHOUNA12C]OCJ20876.1 peptide ABC transporter [Agrobacterium sp. B133/95]NTF50900.1 ABC transporter substrate-binding protein [Rhizobium rhizogenes]
MAVTRRGFIGTAGVVALTVAIGHRPAWAGSNAVPVKGGSLVYGVETEPNTLNPHLNGQAKAKLVLRNAYESLLARTADGGYVPWLAAGYEISDDGKTYTFKLREDVTFSDGEKLDAAAVVLNFTKLKEPLYSGSISAGYLSYVMEAKAADQHTVVLKLDRVYAPFLDGVASIDILSPRAFASTQIKSGGPEIAGTGPFILDRYVRGQEIHFVRNPDYKWAPASAGHQGPAYLDEVTYRFLSESSVRTGALISGQVDVIEGISGNDAALFKDNSDFTYQSALNPGTPYTLYLNTTYGPTKDVRVRKAVIAATDVGQIVDSVYRRDRTRAWGVLTPADKDFYDASIEGSYGFDPKLANQLLDEAGWTARDADGFRTKDGARLSIEIVQAQVTLRDQRDVLLQALQAQARQSAGIELILNNVDSGTYSERQKSGKYGAIPNSTTNQGNAVTIYFHYLPPDQGGSINYSRTEAPEVLAWLNKAASTLDAKERFATYADLQRFAIVEQAFGLPLYVPEDQIAASTRVRGVGFRPFKQLPENAYDIWLGA